MPTATRRAAGLILLGALIAQAPLAAAYAPREPDAGVAAPTTGPSVAPTAVPTTIPTTDPTSTPTIDPEPDPTAPTAPDDKWPGGEPVGEPPAANSWTEVVQEVIRTAPESSMLRATALADQSKQVMRCFKLETENYCLGLGFVDQLPSGAQLSAMTAAPEAAIGSRSADDDAEQDIATGALSPAEFVSERSSLSDNARLDAELDEMQAAWEGREKARLLRELDEPTGTSEAPAPTPTPTATPTTPERTTPASPGQPKPKPPVSAPVKLPSSSYIMKGFATSQDKGYWCGPATFQSIDWADDNQKDTQASWAKDLGSSTSGTGISAMVKQTNLKTNWDLAAGSYIVQNVGHWNTQKFFSVHQNHLGDAKPAPVIEHVQLLKRYFPYLAFNHSGHYQVGRGYDAKKGTIGIYEVFNERRFNSRGNTTNGPKNIPASALFNATLANTFQNIGL